MSLTNQHTQNLGRHIPGHFSIYARYTSKHVTLIRVVSMLGQRLGMVLFTVTSADWLSATT